MWIFFFFQAEDGIRDLTVTGVQTCALPISRAGMPLVDRGRAHREQAGRRLERLAAAHAPDGRDRRGLRRAAIGRGAWRGRGEISGGAGSFKKKKQTKAVQGKLISTAANLNI